MNLPEFEKLQVEYYHYNKESWKVIVYPCFDNGEAYRDGGGLYLATFKTREEAREYKTRIQLGILETNKLFREDN